MTNNKSWMPLVSVVMSCYNNESTVKDTIQSILNQSCSDFEFIIVDDCSTDNTVGAIRSFDDSRIILIESKVNDMVDSLNSGLKRATGKYIALIDADDLAVPERLLVQTEFLEANKDVDVCCGMAKCFGLLNNITGTPKTITGSSMFLRNDIVNTTAMIRRDSLARLPELYRHGFAYAQDFDMWLRMLESGFRIESINHVLTLYRMHENQASTKHSDIQAASAKKIIDRYKNKNDITIIITAHNDSILLEHTLKSIYTTSFNMPNIVLVNDASTDGFDYKGVADRFKCTYIENEERIGVAASRTKGVDAACTKYIFLMDAHMAFQNNAWDIKLGRFLDENPRSITCFQTSHINIRGSHIQLADSKLARGARLSLKKDKPLDFEWCKVESLPIEAAIEIPIVMGATYGISKEYFYRLHGLTGLKQWGSDEFLLSSKCWIEGGKCYLLKDVTVGHYYRSEFPYEMDAYSSLSNRLFVASIIFSDDTIEKIRSMFKERYGEENYKKILSYLDGGLIEKERNYLKSISKRSGEYFLALCMSAMQ